MITFARSAKTDLMRLMPAWHFSAVAKEFGSHDDDDDDDDDDQEEARRQI